MTDWNRQTIEEFRANEGRVGGFFEGKPILLLRRVLDRPRLHSSSTRVTIAPMRLGTRQRLPQNSSRYRDGPFQKGQPDGGL